MGTAPEDVRIEERRTERLGCHFLLGLEWNTSVDLAQKILHISLKTQHFPMVTELVLNNWVQLQLRSEHERGSRDSQCEEMTLSPVKVFKVQKLPLGRS
jgi:hypothetical protein